jgi:hypothetical protein
VAILLPRTIDTLDPVAHLPIDPVAHLPIDLDPPPSTDDEEDVSDKSNLLESSTASMTASMTELLIKHATLEDVVIVPKKDDDGNIVQDDNGIKVMIATTIKGVAIKSIRMDSLRPFCIKVGIQTIRAKSKVILSRLIVYSKQMDSAHEQTGLAGKQSSQQKMAMKIRLLNACFSDLYYKSFIAVNHRKTKKNLTEEMLETANTSTWRSRTWRMIVTTTTRQADPIFQTTSIYLKP